MASMGWIIRGGNQDKVFFLAAIMPKELKPRGSFQLKWWSSRAKGSSILAKPKEIPGQILLPAPNDKSSK